MEAAKSDDKAITEQKHCADCLKLSEIVMRLVQHAGDRITDLVGNAAATGDTEVIDAVYAALGPNGVHKIYNPSVIFHSLMANKWEMIECLISHEYKFTSGDISYAQYRHAPENIVDLMKANKR